LGLWLSSGFKEGWLIVGGLTQGDSLEMETIMIMEMEMAMII
jgi:hypothetical protein